MGNQMSVKSSNERRRRSMKFPVAPESMRTEVSTVLVFPCSEIGKVIDQLVGFATST